MIFIQLDTTLLLSLICTCISIIWSLVSMRDRGNTFGYNEDEMPFKNLHGLVSILTPIGLIVALIMVFIKVNFITWLTYFSIALVAAIIPGIIISGILASIFGLSILRGIAPAISCIVSSYWMFSSITSL